jgi:DNA repair exonuclease SbcCD nuclease subunit
MSKTLVVGDLHLEDRVLSTGENWMKLQVDYILRLCRDYDHIVFLGDIHHKRRPNPSELLAGRKLFTYLDNGIRSAIVLRGNHDSEDKSDNGVTPLSLYADYCSVVLHTWRDHDNKHYHIAHFEDEQRIIEELTKAAKDYPDYTVFGHFGFNGCMNSVGTVDFGLDLSHFKNLTFLGHIHHQNMHEEKAKIVGTPYATSYQEADKESIVVELDNETQEYTTIVTDPPFQFTNAHIDNFSLDDYDSSKYNFVRLYVSDLDKRKAHDLIQEVQKDFHGEFKVHILPSIDRKSPVRVSENIEELTEKALKDYVKNNQVDGLTAKQLWTHYQEVKQNADQDC